jgi:hypothetical protein
MANKCEEGKAGELHTGKPVTCEVEELSEQALDQVAGGAQSPRKLVRFRTGKALKDSVG